MPEGTYFMAMKVTHAVGDACSRILNFPSPARASADVANAIENFSVEDPGQILDGNVGEDSEVVMVENDVHTSKMVEVESSIPLWTRKQQAFTSRMSVTSELGGLEE